MATADTVDLGLAHPPREESLRAFDEVETDLKRELLHMKHTYLKHEPEYFASVQDLSDADLTSFGSADLESVRVAVSAYGVHIFGKVRLPAMPDGGPAYLHVRIFVGGSNDESRDDGGGNNELGTGITRLHCIHTEEREEPDGGKRYRAVFTKDDPLEWFDT